MHGRKSCNSWAEAPKPEYFGKPQKAAFKLAKLRSDVSRKSNNLFFQVDKQDGNKNFHERFSYSAEFLESGTIKIEPKSCILSAPLYDLVYPNNCPLCRTHGCGSYDMFSELREELKKYSIRTKSGAEANDAD